MSCVKNRRNCFLRFFSSGEKSNRIGKILPVILLLSLFVTGCSSKKVQYGNLELVDVSGTVTLDQKPLANAQVLFLADNRSYSYGVTDEKGRYSLMFNSKKTGTKSGEKKVEIWTTRTGADFDVLMKKSCPNMELVPEKYNSKSTLKVNVSPSDRKFDFDLVSNGIKRKFYDPDSKTE